MAPTKNREIGGKAVGKDSFGCESRLGRTGLGRTLRGHIQKSRAGAQGRVKGKRALVQAAFQMHSDDIALGV